MKFGSLVISFGLFGHCLVLVEVFILDFDDIFLSLLNCAAVSVQHSSVRSNV